MWMGGAARAVSPMSGMRYPNLTLSASRRCLSSTLGQFYILTHPCTHPPAVRLCDAG